MNIVITKGRYKDLGDCEEALRKSELGKRYFTSEGSAKEAVQEGFDNETLYVALKDGICVGFLYYLPKGAFHAFPYLHLVAVKEAYRGMGIGKKMIDYLESMLREKSTKLFLVVADYNPDAKRFYERLGYLQVGEIPDLYRQGITEYLMMKRLS